MSSNGNTSYTDLIYSSFAACVGKVAKEEGKKENVPENVTVTLSDPTSFIAEHVHV